MVRNEDLENQTLLVDKQPPTRIKNKIMIVLFKLIIVILCLGTWGGATYISANSSVDILFVVFWFLFFMSPTVILLFVVYVKITDLQF